MERAKLNFVDSRDSKRRILTNKLSTKIKHFFQKLFSEIGNRFNLAIRKMQCRCEFRSLPVVIIFHRKKKIQKIFSMKPNIRNEKKKKKILHSTHEFQTYLFVSNLLLCLSSRVFLHPFRLFHFFSFEKDSLLIVKWNT